MRRKTSSFDDFPLSNGNAPLFRRCDAAGCDKAGEYRAPKDRSLKDYFWFCLEHVQEYNKNWDYYAGMSPEEIEAYIRHDIGWQRPTWKLGERPSQMYHYIDPLNMRSEFSPEKGYDGRDNASCAPNVDPSLAEAAKILELEFPLNVKQVKMNYKRLAKAFHPDSNGGDKDAEEKFKSVAEAYRLIMAFLKA